MENAATLFSLRHEDGLSSYLREIGKHSILTRKQEKRLLLRMREGDRQAFKELINANLRFVVSVCRKFQHQGLPLTDLISEGNLGLIRAAQSFDVTQTCRFISYAVWWIRQRIMQALAEQSRFLSIPVGKAALLRKIAHANKTIEQRGTRPPSISELAEALCLKEKEVAGLLEIGRAPISIYDPVTAGEDGALVDIIKDESAESPEQEYQQRRLRRDLLGAVDGLRELEREVLRHYFGLGARPAMTLGEISQAMGLSPERVRQIKDQAINRLRHPSRIERLRALA